MSLIDAKIELTKIPKDKLFKSEETGRIYLDCKVAKRQTADQYGNTHTIYVQKAKGDEKIYIGNGKEVEFEQKPSAPIENDDLPF